MRSKVTAISEYQKRSTKEQCERVPRSEWKAYLARGGEVAEMRVELEEFRLVLERAEDDLLRWQDDITQRLRKGAYLEGGFATREKASGE